MRILRKVSELLWISGWLGWMGRDLVLLDFHLLFNTRNLTTFPNGRLGLSSSYM